MSKSRFVTLLDTGEKVPREKGYYAPKQNRYFSSKEAYERWCKPREKDEYWQKTIGLLMELTEFPSNMKLPGRFLKRLKDEYMGIGFEAVYTALVYKKKEIEYRMKINDFADYNHMLNYIAVMIQGDVPMIQKQLEYLKYNKREKSFESNEVSDNLDFQIPEKHTERKDLSSLIGE